MWNLRTGGETKLQYIHIYTFTSESFGCQDLAHVFPLKREEKKGQYQQRFLYINQPSLI